MALSFGQYSRFLAVGGFVGLATVAFREGVALLLGRDDRTNYSISVIVAYALGIALSFAINGRLTFARTGRSDAGQFARFVAVALVGALCTWVLSLLLRYTVDLHTHLGRPAAALSFGTAAVLTSLITYPLNAYFVFGKRR